ncbi:hypothetical protein GCM10008935_26210 [Alkalibacillus silvisoli]|uniref:Glycosyltransferase 2-like domain-containing protein n=2 Tax=Alkalibacillus silvisoli TaxID=392823 RepID=A0ABP3K2K6_9BACI
MVPTEYEKICVIIPTYNRSNIIERTIQSVLNQSYPNIEIVVVDDNSTDNTREVIENISSRRLKYYKNSENSNAAASRNKGVEISESKYVAFLDSDDVWERDHLMSCINRLKSTNADGVFGNFSKVINGFFLDGNISAYSNDYSTIAEYIFSRKGTCRTSTFFMKRNAFEVIKFDEALNKHQDWDFAIRFDEKFKLAYNSIPTVVLYQDRADRMSSKMNHEATKVFLMKHECKVSNYANAIFNFNMAFHSRRLERGNNIYCKTYIKNTKKYISLMDYNKFKFSIMIQLLILQTFGRSSVFVYEILLKLKNFKFKQINN